MIWEVGKEAPGLGQTYTKLV